MTQHPVPRFVPTTFEYPAPDDGIQVSIVGSWDQWSKKTPMERQPNTNLWQVILDLNPGHVTFKFVTDGKWLTAKTYDVVDDGFGGKNNSRVIANDNGVILEDNRSNGHEHVKEEPQEGNKCLLC